MTDTYENLTDDQETKMTDFKSRLVQALGLESDAEPLFAYPGKEGKVVMTFEEALQVSGHHYADLDEDILIGVFKGFYDDAVSEAEGDSENFEIYRQKGRERVLAELAKRGLAE